MRFSVSSWPTVCLAESFQEGSEGCAFDSSRYGRFPEGKQKLILILPSGA